MELFGITFDLGGVLSLIATIIITYIVASKFKLFEKFKQTLEKTPSFRIVTVLILMSAGLVAVWNTVRLPGLYIIKHYIGKVTTIIQRMTYSR